MKNKCALAFLMVLSSAAYAETTYEIDPDDSTAYVATVPKGESNPITEAAAAILNGNSVAKFIKRGEGTLVANLALAQYTGDLIVEEGVYQSCPTAASNTTVGKLDSAGKVTVCDGATLELKTSVWSTTMASKEVHISGRGFGGRGALVQNESSVTGNGPFGKIILDDDALICNYSRYGFALASSAEGTVTVGSHCLSVGGTGQIGFSQGGKLTVSNGESRMVSEGGGLYFENTWGSKWNFWHSSVGLTVTNNSKLILNPLYASNFAFAIDLFPGASISVNSDTKSFTANSEINRISSNGGNSGLTLLDPDRNAVTFSKSADFLIVTTQVKGGGLSVGTSSVGGRLALQTWVVSGVTKSNNTFTNGIVATKSVVSAAANGLIPAKGAALTLNDSTAELKSGVTYALPPLVVHGSGTVTSGSGTWRNSVSKDGEGVLTYDSLIGSDRLDVQGGTVRFVPQSGELPVFGMIGGAHGGSIDFADIAYAAGAYSGVPILENCPSLSVAGDWTIDMAELPETERMTTEGTLAFADGAVLTVTGDLAKMPWMKKNMSWTIAWAEGGISGLPTLAPVGDGKYVWSLEKSADGKRLLLKKSGDGLILLLK